MIQFSITEEEYNKFQAYYHWNLLKDDTYRYGQAFLNYFPDAEEYLMSISNLGTPSDVHVPDLDYILWNEKSYNRAKSMIEECIDIIKE
jgi:hypothetical protein